MTCPACTRAEADPRSSLYQAGCRNCEARSLAQSPMAWKALHAQTAVPLQEAIERVWGVDGYEEGRRAVWAWIQRLRQ